jgi:protein-S-isoprenylcysteine O-methyltransferase Ste14
MIDKTSAFVTALKVHKRWANGASIVSIILVVGLLTTTALLADVANADASLRIGMYIVMVGVIIVVCIWQAAAFVAASIDVSIGKKQAQMPEGD